MITWSVDPTALSLGPLTIRWYGLLFLTGFYLGLMFMNRVCRLENKPQGKMDSLLVYVIAGTTIGARLGHCFFYEWDYYSQHLLEIPQIWKGGLASHGGGLGVIIALYLFSRKNPEFSFGWICDRVAVPLVLAGACIRLGNLMNSEIIGKPTDGTWGVIFTRIDQIPRHPAQVYESLWYVLVWLGGLFWYRKFDHQPKQGLLFGWVVSGIFVGRILIEQLKENQEAFESNMTLNMGQLLSLPYLAVGLFLFFRGLKNSRAAAAEAVTDTRATANKKSTK